ncbi:uncharacterized protein CELE_JC8.16 [Caenorhabditis elegans]|uniref:Transmembrane protein n=1 Tax=Caenorhabditis elegans TaxID=6239 RepID=D3KFW6_CAEEL|nr:Transmembrane protein [Caenorhabditis elegans]CBJ25083.1 Transmembrane protein [Caenorhabditis elegans]|eukprot:NP_001255717.1 Uncharacterized protein CELE_JC8.16 [Caenorhabditis elegans]
MKKPKNAGIVSQFFLIATWFTLTLMSGIMYRMVLVATNFEFPCMIILCQSIFSLIFLQISRLLFPDLCVSWSTSIDFRALPASTFLTFSVCLDMLAYYQETSSSKLMEYLAAPAIAIILLRSAIGQRSRIGKKLPFILSCLSVIFSYFTINVTVLTPDGMLFGFMILVFNIATFFTLKTYLKRNSISQFLFSHFSFSTIIFFAYELYKHDIHRLYLYVHLWQLPNFYSVLFSFVFFFSLSLISLCNVIIQFDITLLATALNTKNAWQFVITNFVFRNIVFKPYYDLNPCMCLNALCSFVVCLTIFWIDVRNRNSQIY